MAEVVNVVVAFAVIVFLFRWLTTGDNSSSAASNTLGFKPKNVTDEMVDTIATMFSDISKDNIRYDLLRTGNVERTTNKILERGFLDAPSSGYYTLYPRNADNSNTPARPAGSSAATSTSSTSTAAKSRQDLISRYQLEKRISENEVVSPEDVGGKAVWEDTPEKREANLKERKAKMILAARQRILAQQQEKK